MSLFSEFDNVRTLYVIGNGFDLHHGMKTSYADFHSYVKNEYSSWAYFFSYIYPNGVGCSPWSDLEGALGLFDIIEIYNNLTEDYEKEDGHEGRYFSQMEDTPEILLRPMYENFRKYYNGWVHSIRICGEKDEQIPYFCQEGLFFTFNYIETLEKLYEIPQENINYIHGRRYTNDELIVGHNKPCINYKNILRESDEFYKEEPYRIMAMFFNNLKKDVDGIIRRNESYWKTLGKIDKVVVYGHSLNEIDRPYFEKIKQSIMPNAQWFFGCHNKKDKEHAHMLSNVLKIQFSSQSCFDF